MNKFSGILICTDLDGTLYRRDKTISEENLEAIEYFKSRGGYFTFITGRMPSLSKDVYTKINPNVPFGCINGSAIYDHRQEKYLMQIPLDSDVHDLIEHVEKNIASVGIQVTTFNDIYICRDNPSMERFRRTTGCPYEFRHYRDIKEPLGKILFSEENDDNIKLLSELLHSHPLSEKFDFTRSSRTLFEILPKDVHKGSGLIRLAELLKVDVNRTIAIGDYENDIPMLRTAKLAVAVSNACEAAKKEADIITVSNEEHAIKKIIDDIDSGKIVI
ncbi:MAG: HAD family phosphatase [Ruminococcaceae bacterium]|nr:HAD family phosphatase [Oscillospiraceae bacterium]